MEREEISRSDLAGRLRHLRDLCRESQERLESVSKAIERSDVKAQLIELTAERKEVCEELQREAVRYAAKRDIDESPLSAVSIALTNARDILGLTEANQVLAECLEREEDLLEEYGRAFCLQLPQELDDILRRQEKLVAKSCEILARLRELYDDSLNLP